MVLGKVTRPAAGPVRHTWYAATGRACCLSLRAGPVPRCLVAHRNITKVAYFRLPHPHAAHNFVNTIHTAFKYNSYGI